MANATCCWIFSLSSFFQRSEGKKTPKWTFKIEIWPVWSQWGVLLQKLKSTKRGVKSSRNTQWVLKKYLLVDKKVCFGTTAAVRYFFFIKQTKTWITLGIYNHDVVQTLEDSYICFFADWIQLRRESVFKKNMLMSLNCCLKTVFKTTGKLCCELKRSFFKFILLKCCLFKVMQV